MLLMFSATNVQCFYYECYNPVSFMKDVVYLQSFIEYWVISWIKCWRIMTLRNVITFSQLKDWPSHRLHQQLLLRQKLLLLVFHIFSC